MTTSIHLLLLNLGQSAISPFGNDIGTTQHSLIEGKHALRSSASGANLLMSCWIRPHDSRHQASWRCNQRSTRNRGQSREPRDTRRQAASSYCYLSGRGNTLGPIPCSKREPERRCSYVAALYSASGSTASRQKWRFTLSYTGGLRANSESTTKLCEHA